MNRNRLAALLLGSASLGFAANAALSQENPGNTPVPPPPPPAYDLVAIKVEKLPELKAELTADWKQAFPCSVMAVKGKGPDVKVELRAMHDGKQICFLVSWDDADASFAKKGWQYTKEGWQQVAGDEDRISFAFNIDAAGFAEKGCGVLCHNGDMRTPAEGQKADLWHWKAARGGRFGWCDDQHFAFADGNGRTDDAGTSAYTDNQAKEGKAPLRRWKDDADREGPFNEDTSVPLDEKFTPTEGYTVPSILLRKPDGSRADVEAVGRHDKGRWTVMLRRKLDTGADDDVRFTSEKDCHFTVAVFDNTGAKSGTDHKKSKPLRLHLQ